MNIIDIMPPLWQSYGLTIKSFDVNLISFYVKALEAFPDLYVNVKDGKRVNNWCGYRTPECNIGAPKSAHKVGKALDLHCSNLEQLTDFIYKNGRNYGITRVEAKESTPTWRHVDVMPLSPEQAKRVEQIQYGIYVFKP